MTYCCITFFSTMVSINLIILLSRERLKAEVEGLPIPTELPTASSNSNNSSRSSTAAATGVSSYSNNSNNAGTASVSTTPMGTDPLAGETEAQYVARQRKLQEEVSILLVVSRLKCTQTDTRDLVIMTTTITVIIYV